MKRSEDGNGGGQADAELNAADMERLTDVTAAALMAAADEGTTAWVECGRILKDYAEKLQPNGKFTKPDPYDILASHKDVPYSPSRLRYMVASFELYEEFGGKGKAPKLGVTYFTLVLAKGLDRHLKEKFLRAALDNKWTTRQLKAAIEKELKGDGKAKPKPQGSPDFPSAWKDIDIPVSKLNADLTALRSHRPLEPIPDEILDNLKILAAAIDEILKAHGQEAGAR